MMTRPLSLLILLLLAPGSGPCRFVRGGDEFIVGGGK